MRISEKAGLDKGLNSVLEVLSRATETIRRKLSWRRQRQASLAIDKTLKELVPSDLARRVATAMTGTAPDNWLTVSESLTALSDLGVKVYDRKLRRLYRKARQSSTGELIVAMNGKGQWNSPDSNKLRDPIAVITVRVAGAVHFQINPFPPEN